MKKVVIKIPTESLLLGLILFIIGWLMGSANQKAKWIEKAIDLNKLKELFKPSEETDVGE